MAYNKYKTCFVLSCKNTTVKSPNTKFITVPVNPEKKKKWFEAINRPYKNNLGSYFCCEEHFDLKEDLESYIKYSLMGGRIIMKPDVVPHIFKRPNRASPKEEYNETEASETMKMDIKIEQDGNEMKDPIFEFVNTNSDEFIKRDIKTEYTDNVSNNYNFEIKTEEVHIKEDIEKDVRWELDTNISENNKNKLNPPLGSKKIKDSKYERRKNLNLPYRDTSALHGKCGKLSPKWRDLKTSLQNGGKFQIRFMRLSKNKRKFEKCGVCGEEFWNKSQIVRHFLKKCGSD